MENKKQERLCGLDEIKGARITLNNLERIIRRSTGEITKDDVLFQIMLMKAHLETLESMELDLMYEREIQAHKDYVDRWVQVYLKCKWAPCHKCHHLNNGCYEPDKEMVEKIKEIWEKLPFPEAGL